MEKQTERLLRGGLFLRLLEQEGADIRNKYGLKKADVRILYYLANNPDQNTAKDIQAFFNMNKGYISQTVDNLQGRGLLAARQDSQDRRLIHYTVTEAAADIMKNIDQMWTNINFQLFKGLTDNEIEMFSRVVCKIENNINNMLD